MSARTRRYEETHPWLTFTVKTHIDGAAGTMWYQLGRIVALCESIKHTALRPELARMLHDLYLVKGAQATIAIEGNTLTEEQVRAVVLNGEAVKPSKEYLAQEARNVVAAFNDIGTDLRGGHVPDLSSERLKELNELVQAGLDVDDHVTPGEFRTASVGVGPYLAPPSEDVDYLVKRLFEFLNGPEFTVGDGQPAMAVCILKAIVAHLYVAWIHPFGDGNGRTARMVEFQILVSGGVPSPAAHLLSNHYNATRDAYYRELDKTSKLDPKGRPLGFINYALQGFNDGLEEQLEVMENDLEKLVWRDLVDHAYGHDCGKPDQRRKRLACHLFEAAAPMTASALFKDPTVSSWYSDKTTKTLTRDLNDLKAKNLVQRTQGGWRAFSDIVLGMRPESQF